VFFVHSRGQDRIPALVRAYMEELGFVMPEKAASAPKLTWQEQQILPIVKAGIRVKDEPGRAINLRPSQVRMQLSVEEHAENLKTIKEENCS
jgi:hypothetical protein